MRIAAVTYERGRITLETPDIQAAMRFAYTFEAGDYELQKVKKRRSIDANAYAWVLMDKLAAKLGISKMEVYRNSIKSIGGVSETVCVLKSASDKLCEGWEHNGSGWQTELMPSKLEGCVTVTLYYGSSTYDTKQMASLIDNLVQDCRALEIETRPADEIEALLEAWK